ncbi:MAG: polysaccharide biosynthesis tyrosine autokinase [Candidatus Dormibacteraeota bacterium]|nr:polysaccharide biosynthesis tyrosine autokinase [Candidatus Dormibacteraeota bacterium]
MKLTAYLRALRRSAWLLVLCPLVAGIVAGAVSRSLPPVYEATVSLLVRPSQPLTGGPGVVTTTTNEISQTYAELIVQRPLLERVISDLNLKTRPETLRDQIKVTPQASTTILDVAVTSGDPRLARDIANTLVNDFIQQIRQIEQQERANQNTRSGDNLVVVSPAVLPDRPVSPNVLRNVLLAVLVSLCIALALVFLRDYLDQSVKSDDELLERTGLVSIGHVGYTKAARGRRGELVVLDGTSPAAEAYRALRTNVLFSAVDREVKCLLITSPRPGDGKSRTAANLALALAQSGHRVVLVDTDFRRPSLHRVLGRIRNTGLTNLMIEEGTEDEHVLPVDGIPDLWLLPSGPIPPNPSELLGSGRMRHILHQLRQRFDWVILDTPPVNSVTDASVLATMVDGALIVIESGKTTYPEAAQARRSVERVGGYIVGAVINKLRPDSRSHYVDYYGYPAEARKTNGGSEHEAEKLVSAAPESHRP